MDILSRINDVENHLNLIKGFRQRAMDEKKYIHTLYMEKRRIWYRTSNGR